MSRPIAAVLLFMTLLAGAFAQEIRKTLRAGDQIIVTLGTKTPTTVDTFVESDGRVHLPRIGGVYVAGMTVGDAEHKIRAAYKKIYKDPIVSLYVKKPLSEVVYVIGTRAPMGSIEIQPDMDLRSVLGKAQLPDDADKIMITVFRRGVAIAEVDPQKLLQSSNEEWNGPMKPEDVVSIQPRPFARVWVTGNVGRPGEVRIDARRNVYEAVAAAGGVTKVISEQTFQEADFDIVVRSKRGVERFSAVAPSTQQLPLVEDGATITVELSLVTVTVIGEVNSPGRHYVSRSADLSEMVGAAGGVKPTGTLSEAILVRGDSVTKVNLGTPQPGQEGLRNLVQFGDVVYVPVNQKTFNVLGRATVPGTYLMADERVYRASDALAAAKGPLARFSSDRRMVIARFDDKGKLSLIKFNMDEFYKRGKKEANPEIRPGDTLFVAPNDEFSLSQAAAVLTGLFSLNRIIRP